ncbi:MAG: protease modulator HflC [Chloroflexi bacterium]|nr:protease modulator HflC [Chloroflexota bacterium]
MKALIVIGVVLLIGLFVVRQSLYVVDVTEQVLILRFGEVKQLQRTPGIFLKAPFVDNAVRFDRRVLRIDANPVAMPDVEKENLVIDSYGRYKIVDPIQFRKTLQTEANARSRLGDIVTSSLRTEIARRNRIEIIGAKPLKDEQGNQIVNDEGIPLYVGTETRAEILANVLREVKNTVIDQEFGIVMIDVRIKRADFPDEVTPSIFTRMRAERNRIASRFRAEGAEKELRIRADANKEATIIRAEAQRESSQIRGTGEAEAIRILGDALNQDPEFFAFRRSLDAYRKFLTQRDTIIMSSDADLFKFLQSPLEQSVGGRN